MHPNVKRLFFAIALVALLVSPAIAGPLVGDPNATLSGSTGFLTSLFGAVKANVEYAVYAPGMFGTSAALGNPAADDPSGGTEWVYTYEVFNNAGGFVPINTLSIHLLSGTVGLDPVNVGHAPGTPEGGVAPNILEFIPNTGEPTNVKWTWTTTPLNVGLHSDIVLFTSIHHPDFSNATIGGGIDAASGQLPSPTLMPEPSSLILALMAAIGLFAAGYVRRRVV